MTFSLTLMRIPYCLFKNMILYMCILILSRLENTKNTFWAEARFHAIGRGRCAYRSRAIVLQGCSDDYPDDECDNSHENDILLSN